MTWLTKKAFGMHWGNHQGHRVISISQKCVDQPCMALPFSSTSGSVFICVCIQRSELPLKWSRKVIDFIGFSLKKRKRGSEGEYFEYCVSAFKKPWLCISIALPAWQTPGRGRRPPEGSLFYPEGRTCREQLFKPYLQLLHDTGNESNLLDIRQKKERGFNSFVFVTYLMCLSFSTTRGFKLHPQWVSHADAAHCGICWFSGILHLQV